MEWSDPDRATTDPTPIEAPVLDGLTRIPVKARKRIIKLTEWVDHRGRVIRLDYPNGRKCCEFCCLGCGGWFRVSRNLDASARWPERCVPCRTAHRRKASRDAKARERANGGEVTSWNPADHEEPVRTAARWALDVSAAQPRARDQARRWLAQERGWGVLACLNAWRGHQPDLPEWISGYAELRNRNGYWSGEGALVRREWGFKVTRKNWDQDSDAYRKEADHQKVPWREPGRREPFPVKVRSASTD